MTTTDVQLQLRRRTASQLASFTGAAQEIIADSTNNRLTVHDGSTAGGFAAAKLSEIGGGFLNRFRNGSMDVWQRGTVPAIPAGGTGAVYTADGWIVGWTAANSPVVSQAAGRGPTRYAIEIEGGSGTTSDIFLAQRIESFLAASLAGQQVTVQAQFYLNVPGAFAPQLTVHHANSIDNFSSLTADLTASMQTCASGAWTRVAYTFTGPALSGNGLVIAFDCGSSIQAGQNILVTELDIRVTPGVPTGLPPNIAQVPPPELRPIAAEQMLCQRHYQTIGYMQGAAYSGSGISLGTAFPVTMRATPAIALLTTAPTIVQFTVGSFTGSSSALVGGGTTASPSGVGVGISGFSGLTAGALPVFSTTAQLLSASAEL